MKTRNYVLFNSGTYLAVLPLLAIVSFSPTARIINTCRITPNSEGSTPSKDSSTIEGVGKKTETKTSDQIPCEAPPNLTRSLNNQHSHLIRIAKPEMELIATY